MYKRLLAQFLLCNMIIAVCWFSVKVMQINQTAATQAFKLSVAEESEQEEETRKDSFLGMLRSASSGQRVVEYTVLEQTSISLSQKEYEVLTRIVEAEAGTQDEKGRMLVAGVILNRVKDKKFPNTITEVVFQEQNGTCQFSPVSNGRYYSVEVSKGTKKAVDRVLAGEDITKGALYFASREYASPEKMAWFDNYLTPLFTHGGHEFFY